MKKILKKLFLQIYAVNNIKPFFSLFYFVNELTRKTIIVNRFEKCLILYSKSY